MRSPLFILAIGLVLIGQMTALSAAEVTPAQKLHFFWTYHLPYSFWRRPFFKQLNHLGWNSFSERVADGKVKLQEKDRLWLINYWAERLVEDVADPTSPLYQQVIAEKVVPQFQRQAPQEVAVRLKPNPHLDPAAKRPLAFFVEGLVAEFGEDLDLLFDPSIMFSNSLGAARHNRTASKIELCLGARGLRNILTARRPEGILLNEIIFHELFHVKAHRRIIQQHDPGYLIGSILPQNDMAKTYAYGGSFAIDEIGAYLHGMWANLQFLKEHYTEQNYLTNEGVARMLARENYIITHIDADLAMALEFLQLTQQLLAQALQRLEDHLAAGFVSAQAVPLNERIMTSANTNALFIPVALASPKAEFDYVLPLTFFSKVMLAAGYPIILYKNRPPQPVNNDYIYRPAQLKHLRSFLKKQDAYLRKIETTLLEFKKAWKPLRRRINWVIARPQDYAKVFAILQKIPSPYPEEKTSLFSSAATPHLFAAQDLPAAPPACAHWFLQKVQQKSLTYSKRLLYLLLGY